MGVIYSPKGRAAEYSPKACNLFAGCTNGCRYCYVPDVLHVDRETFHASCDPRKNILALLEHDAVKWTPADGPVLLCFTCDPYPNDIDLVANITRPALKTLSKYNVQVRILTKNPSHATEDFQMIRQANWDFGVTLTGWLDINRRRWEPEAESIGSRLHMLREAKKWGIRTWASVEPVLCPQDALDVIDEAAAAVDVFYVGKLNAVGRRHPNLALVEIEEGTNWQGFLHDVEKLLGKHPHVIKHDLEAYR